VPTLHELQRSLRRSIVERETTAAAAQVIGDGLTPAERLSVYRNTFVSSLTNALRLCYPAVHRLVGADFFDSVAQLFIQEQPPHSAYLDEYGAEFPEFVARFPPAAALCYLADIARLEWAVNRALHARDAQRLELELLADVEPIDHGRVCFVPDPSVSLLRASYPADIIWRAVLAQDDAMLSAIDLTEVPVWLMVQRLKTGIDVIRLSEPAWHFAAELCAGRALQDAIDAVPTIDAPALLAEHLAAGRFIGFSVTDVAAAAQPLGSSP